jgi:hypothetical protein
MRQYLAYRVALPLMLGTASTLIGYPLTGLTSLALSSESSRRTGRARPLAGSGRRTLRHVSRNWDRHLCTCTSLGPFRSSTGAFCDRDDDIRRTQTVFGAPPVSGRAGQGTSTKIDRDPARSTPCALEERFVGNRPVERVGRRGFRAYIITRTVKGAAVSAAGSGMVGPPSSVVQTRGCPMQLSAFTPTPRLLTPSVVSPWSESYGPTGLDHTASR